LPGTNSARIAPWRDPRFRSAVFQGLFAAAVLAVLLFLAWNTAANFARYNIRFGLQFLDRPAGFDILQRLIPYSEASTYGRAFVVAILNTLVLSAVGIVIATVLGFFVGLARLSSNWLVSRLAAIYIETLRNIPLLLQIFFWYFAILRPLPGPRQSLTLPGDIFLNNRGLYLPSPVFEPGSQIVALALLAAIVASLAVRAWARRKQAVTGQRPPAGRLAAILLIGLPLLAAAMTGFPLGWDRPVLGGFNFSGGVVVLPEFVAMAVALSTYSASFIAEIVRGGVLSVPAGQVEAARSVGLRPGPIYRLVVIPQALRAIVPPLTSQYLNLTKNSSLAAAIAYPELTQIFAGTVLSQTGQPFEVMALTMGVYLAISLVISWLMNWYNRRVALRERPA
jgi:general L-amino acid transport system permease protein